MKERVQSFGRFLSAMMMPNIGAFIAWGLITALFIPVGWLPNETLAELVGPMIIYMLPLLIAYQGGKNVWDTRGGIIAIIATMGVIVGADIPMFLGAMIMGPFSAWLLKLIDKALQPRIKAGFEMLINNFTLGILGAILAGVALLGVAPLVTGLNEFMRIGVDFFVEHGLLPLASVFIEPAKVLFLNNAINHGILTPLGIMQVEELGRSIFFLLEANPGPGLGILVAYMVAGKGSARTTAGGAVIIHFLGGIHEIYFPYILMKPILILSAIAGGAAGIFTLTLFNAGLVAPAAPGSIFAVLAMTPSGQHLGVILAVIISAAVSFIIAWLLLKTTKTKGNLEEATAQKDAMKAESKGLSVEATGGEVDLSQVKKIAFACDAGMGSSAMGATILRKKVKEAGLDDIEVVHTSVSSIPADVQVVVTHKDLKERAGTSNPNAKLVLITNFLGAPEYDSLVEELVAARK